MRFIVDVMLGKLARWLRILGYDTWYDARAEDHELLARALQERRVLLTRDAKMLVRRTLPPHLLITSDHWREQLAQVVRHFSLDPVSQRFTRCVECNELLVSVEKSLVQYKVPSHIFDTHDAFYTCPECGKIFWSGSHIERGIAMLDHLFKD